MAKRRKYWEIYQKLLLEHVTKFCPDPSFPELLFNVSGPVGSPGKPVTMLGFLYNIAFGSNQEDNRVVCAVDDLKDHEDIIAIYKHKGTIQIYARSACIQREWLSVARDEWSVDLHILHTDYVKPSFNFPEPSLKQQSFIRSLGHDGAIPSTTKEANALIAQLVS